MSGPNARAWFKYSDHRVISRYVQLTVAFERLMKSPPKATYKTQSTSGATVIKRNPAFDQSLALSRELRSIEQLIAGNPNARLGLERQGLAKPKNDGTSASSDGASDTATTPDHKPAGPLGALKVRKQMN